MDVKKMAKKILIGVVLPLLLIFLIAAGVALWYFFIRQTPERVVGIAIKAARQQDQDTFKEHFSTASVRTLENSWKSDLSTSGGWNQMMDGLLERSGAPPEVVEEVISEDGSRAKVRILLRKKRRYVHLVDEDGDWRIDVLTGINVSISKEAQKAKKDEKKPEDDKKKDDGFSDEPQRDGWWK